MDKAVFQKYQAKGKALAKLQTIAIANNKTNVGSGLVEHRQIRG